MLQSCRYRSHSSSGQPSRKGSGSQSSSRPGTSPVRCDPYGRPHGKRVLAAGNAYLNPQWLADQGFAVVIADGRGTPGRGYASDRAVAGDFAGPVLEDQVEALMSAADQCADLDTSRVGIRG